MSTATVKVNNYTNTTVKERKRKHLQPVSFGQIILPLCNVVYRRFTNEIRIDDRGSLYDRLRGSWKLRPAT